MIGRVISDKMEKTIIVETHRHVTHPKYKKVMIRRAKFVTHDEKKQSGLGDWVKIRETRPMSKTKRWMLIEVIRKAKVRPEHQEGRARSRNSSGSEKAAQS
jgi:small subunit ribosomal protein S17